MSTAAVSSNSIYQELQSFFSQRRSDIKQLGKDLQSGDLTAAQQDYQDLQTLGSRVLSRMAAPTPPRRANKTSKTSALRCSPETWRVQSKLFLLCIRPLFFRR